MTKSRALSALLLGSFLSLPFVLSSCGKDTASNENKTLVVWHWMTDRDEALHVLADRYKKETGNTVQFQLYAPSDVYNQKVRVGAQTGSLPDIYGVLGDARDMASFIEAQHVENLEERLGNGPGSWKEQFYSEALNTTYFKKDNQFNVPEGHYGVPIDVTTIPMIYNKKLFEKAGLNPNQPPQTWDEFIDAGVKLKKAGVTGFVSGWNETWLIFSLVTDLASNLMGEEEKMMETFRGNVSYTDPDWITVFNAFEKLRKAGFADPSLVTLNNKSAEQAFASERSGMTFNGSWAVNVYAGMNPQLDYAPFRPPALGKKFPQTVWGGAGSVFCVNAHSPNKDMAVDFLKWLSAKEQASYLVTTTKNLAATKDVGDAPAVLKQFSELMKDSIHPNRFPVSEDPHVQEVLTKGIQSLLIGEKTPEQVAQDVKKAKEKSKDQ